MNPRLRKYYFSAILLLASLHCLVGQSNFNFQRIDISDGLSHNYVYALYQDSHDYIWIGTAAGLHRFDGRDFITYKNQYGNKYSLGSGYVRAIFESSRGELWVGTEGGGISVLRNNLFENFTTASQNGPNNDVVEHIIEMPDGALYFATWGGGINVYQNGKFSFLNSKNSGLENDNVVDLFYDEETEILWIVTWGGGLYQMYEGIISPFKENVKGFQSDIPRVINKTTDGAIWIGTWGDGLFKYHNDQFEHYTFDQGNENKVDNNKLLSLTPDGEKLWVGSYGGGVYLYENGKFTGYRNNPDNPNSLSSNFIECSIIDNSGSLWIGTYGGGITKFQRSFFESFQHLPERRSSLPHNFVRHLIQFDEQNMLVATRGSGINIFDGQNFTPMDSRYGNQFKFRTITALTKTSSGNYWFAGPIGVGLWSFGNEALENHSNRYGIDLSRYNFYQILEGFDGSIWLAMEFGGGLGRIQDNELTRYLHNPDDETTIGHDEIMCLHQSRDSTIWIGLRRYGLNSFKDGKFKRYRSIPEDNKTLSNDFVLDIHETSDGVIWIATEKGLSKLNPETGTFQRYFASDGLGDDNVVSILTDKDENLWLGTHRGITRFNPKSEQFWNFDYKHGINTHPLNYNTAAINHSTGEMYYGGVNGLLRFHPDSIKPDHSDPNIQITGLKVNNNYVYPSAEGILSKTIEETDLIELDHNQRIVSFTVSAMDFVLSNESYFQYYVEGYHSGWQQVGTQNEITIPELSPGDYTFKVRSSMDQVIWSEPRNLSIKVVTAWWETIWFRVLVGLAVIGLIAIIFKWRLQYLEQQRNKLKRLVSKKTEEITQSNLELKNTLNELRNTQEKLIRSEKLGALSQVVFNLLHELNSPLGSTKAGLEFIKKDILLEIESLPLLINKLSDEEFSYFRNFVEDVIKQDVYYSPEEERELREILKNDLANIGITENRILDSLTAIDSFKLTDSVRALLKLKNATNLIELAETIVLKYHNLRNMDKSMERSINILNSLRTYTDQDTNKSFEPIDLATSIEEAVRLQERFFKNGIELVKDFDPNMWIDGNREQLKQIWLNLISNAAYAMQYRGTLKITLTKTEDCAFVEINDTGSGIPVALQEKVFEPFFTTKPLGEGRGIGLDIVQKIVQEHNGHIKFKSIPGNTTFEISLPILHKKKGLKPKTAKKKPEFWK